jgi:hypothetical protein
LFASTSRKPVVRIAATPISSATFRRAKKRVIRLTARIVRFSASSERRCTRATWSGPRPNARTVSAPETESSSCCARLAAARRSAA